MQSNNLFPLDRNRYFQGKMLTSRDFEIEQKYYNSKRRILNRCILGAGVVCGLGVYKNDDTSICVETGLALDYTGREIVIDQPIIRKLQMIEGEEKLENYSKAYLCLRYDEELKEPVNNLGISDITSQQFNKVRETYKIYLDTEEPDYEVLYSEDGKNDVKVIYYRKDISIIQITPKNLRSGNTFEIKYLIVKDKGLPPLSLDILFQSEYIYDDGKNIINIHFEEDKYQTRNVIMLKHYLKVAKVSNIKVDLVRENMQVKVNMGDFREELNLPVNNEIYVCSDEKTYEDIMNIYTSNLERSMMGKNTPIYLAKIDYVSAGNMHIITDIDSLPFEQRIARDYDKEETVREVSAETGIENSEIISEVEMLNYWQKPEVNATYNKRNNQLKFHFGLPSLEAYDYATSSGILEIPLTGAIRVNSRYVSEEIPHNLGLGDVSLTLAVEYGELNDRKVLFGNGEVFATKENKEVPKVDVAAILYPNRGTFCVGVWCSDYVEGNNIHIRWFASKPTRDTASLKTKEIITVKVIPEIYKMKVRERMHFKAEVIGTEDKKVQWILKEEESGNIDAQGLYQAPSVPGTYEIIATSNVDETVKASAFVIVEE